MTPVLAPDDTTLRKFLLGTLPADEAACVERWLEENPDAVVRLRDLEARDTVVDAIAAGALDTSSPRLSETSVQNLPPAHHTSSPPTVIGTYHVIRELGRGGMGVVLEAEDRHLNRRVAIKLTASEFAANPAARDRFLREERAIARIDHPNVVPVHHAGEHDGQLYLVMPLLKGETLDARLKREKRLSAAEVVRIGREVAAGLAAAHAVGLIHRDIKPANIWLDADTGRARVLDFGLAKPLERSDAEVELTSAGAVLGTLHYMSPQQANGEPLDTRTDLFSLGAVLHHAATGDRPFDGPTKFAVLYAVVNDTPKNLDALAAALPERVAAVVRELLEKRPEQRPSSAKEVVERLTDAPVVVAVPVPAAPVAAPATPWDALDQPEEIVRVPKSAPAPTSKPTTRWKRAATVLALLAFGAITAGIVVIIRDKDGKEIARIDAPNGKSVEVQPSAPGPAPQPVPPATNADQKAAEYVLSAGGTVTIEVDNARKQIQPGAALPDRPFALLDVTLLGNAKVTDAGLANFKGCNKLMHINLTNAKVGDAGIAHFADCKNLSHLQLSNTQVTDKGLAHFKGFTNISALHLDRTAVTNDGLAHFKDCKSLKMLNLAFTAIDDDGIAPFAAYKNLNTLWLEKTQVTRKKIAELSAALARCKIFHDGGVIEPKK